MRPQPFCIVVRFYAKVAYSNGWWLMFDGEEPIDEPW